MKGSIPEIFVEVWGWLLWAFIVLLFFTLFNLHACSNSQSDNTVIAKLDTSLPREERLLLFLQTPADQCSQDISEKSRLAHATFAEAFSIAYTEDNEALQKYVLSCTEEAVQDDFSKLLRIRRGSTILLTLNPGLYFSVDTFVTLPAGDEPIIFEVGT